MLGQSVVLMNWGGLDAVHAVVTRVKGSDLVSLTLFPPMQSPKLVDDVPLFQTREAAAEWLEQQRVPNVHVAYVPDDAQPFEGKKLVVDTEADEQRLNELLGGAADPALPVITGRVVMTLPSTALEDFQ